MPFRSLLAAAAALAVAGTAHAIPITFTTTLSGPGESPPNASTATGTGTVVIDLATHTLIVSETFSGLTTATTASHIHCCAATPGAAAGVATQVPTFSAFPLGVTSGTFTQTLDSSLATTYNPAFVTLAGSVAAAETMLFNGIAAGQAYLNIHTTQFPTGEIRGFLTPVPEPSTYVLMLAGLGLSGVMMRRRMR